MQNEKKPNGNPRKYPFIIQHSHLHVDNDAGLKGIEREVAKAQVDIARAISRLRQAVNLNNAQFVQLVNSTTAVPVTMVGRYVAIGDAYLPTDTNKLSFWWKVLSGMGWKRLEAFLPYLNELYDNEASPLRHRIHLTQWSIEALIGNGGSGGGNWIDLRTLDVASVRNLRNLLGITSPTTQTPASTHRDAAGASAKSVDLSDQFAALLKYEDPAWEKQPTESSEEISL